MVLPVVIVIVGNVLPALPDESGALKERMEIIAFRKSFAETADRQIEDSFDDELPGILLWAIEGWKRLQAQGDFTRSATSAEFRESMAALSTRVKPFIDECCDLGQGHSELKANLWQAFKNYAERNGINVHGNAQLFYADLQTASGCQLTGRPNDLFVRGIALKKREPTKSRTYVEDLIDQIARSKEEVITLEADLVEALSTEEKLKGT
jgi:putative DNA primase/helicase